MRRYWGPLRFFAMHRHWAEFGPPVYVAVASYLGLNKPKAATSAGRDDDDPDGLGELLAMFGDGGPIA